MEGVGLVGQAFQAGWEIETIYLADGVVPESLVVPDGLPDAQIRTWSFGPGVMERVASTETAPPMLAVVQRRTLAPDDLAGRSFVLVGHEIGDPGNAGTMLRSAEAAGAEAVVLTAGSVDAFNPKVVRSSAGALFHMPVVVDITLAALVAGGAAATRTFGTSSHDGTAYFDADLTVPCMIVVGNEAHGLPADAPVDEWLMIPHAGRAESLNVAMASTVLAFEVARQRTRR